MSDASSAPVPPAVPVPAPEKKEDNTPERVLLIGHPKIVFLYPTFIAALLAGILTVAFGNDHARAEQLTTLFFLAVFGLNMGVLTFDFPRTTSLTLFFFLGMLGMGLFLLFYFNPSLDAYVGNIFSAMQPSANAHFYFGFAGVLGFLFVCAAISTRFDYWEVRPNELLHHHGFLADLKRFPAPNLRIDKEINDVFEHLLLGSGRLILQNQTEARAIVIDNVLFINRKEQLITRMLSSLQVSVTND